MSDDSDIDIDFRHEPRHRESPLFGVGQPGKGEVARHPAHAVEETVEEYEERIESRSLSDEIEHELHRIGVLDREDGPPIDVRFLRDGEVCIGDGERWWVGHEDDLRALLADIADDAGVDAMFEALPVETP